MGRLLKAATRRVERLVAIELRNIDGEYVEVGCQGKGTNWPSHILKMHGDGEDLNVVTSVYFHHRWTAVWCVASTGGSSRCCCPLSPV